MRLRISKPVKLFFLQLSISIVVAFLILLLTQDIIFDFPPLRNAELSLYDLRLRARKDATFAKNASDVVIISISQESFRSLPAQWPWPTSYYSQAVKNLKKAGARVVGIDLLFPPNFNINQDHDNEFRSVIHDAKNVVLAGKTRIVEKRFRLYETGYDYGNRFIDSATRFGIVDLIEDDDEVRRRYMPFIYDEHQSQRIPALAVSVLNSYYQFPNGHTPVVMPYNFSCYGKNIPRYDSVSFLINYYGPSRTFPQVEFSDLLDTKGFRTVDEIENGIEINTFDDPADGLLANQVFNNKIVLIGSTTPEDKDLFLTPLSSEKNENDMMYGVEIHANIIQSILDNNFIPRQPQSITTLIVVGLCLFTFVFIAALKTIPIRYGVLMDLLGIALVLALLFIIYVVSMKLFIEQDFLVHMTSAFMAVILSYIGSIVYYYVVERKQKVLIKGMFSQYVNPTIVDELVAFPEKLRLGGERKEVTVFFSDIENFTNISEKLLPEDLVNILNDYLSEMTKIVMSHDGTLDKFEGDAIVAFWGAPIPQTDHAFRACSAAVVMQKKLDELRPKWINSGRPDLRIRIGINTGVVVVGNMGGADRFDYTIIGDSVNLGSRLEGANKQYKTGIMISESTFRAAGEKIIARELDLLVVAGKTEPIRVYELVGLQSDGLSHKKEQFLNIYNKGLKSYRNREWQAAIGAFERALEIYAEDYPSQIYIERSNLYRASPPQQDWNGVFILRTK